MLKPLGLAGSELNPLPKDVNGRRVVQWMMRVGNSESCEREQSTIMNRPARIPPFIARVVGHIRGDHHWEAASFATNCS
jgi:hypothetical protein